MLTVTPNVETVEQKLRSTRIGFAKFGRQRVFKTASAIGVFPVGIGAAEQHAFVAQYVWYASYAWR